MFNKDTACPALVRGGGCPVKAKGVASGCPLFKANNCPYLKKNPGCPFFSEVSPLETIS